jgi:hypothetical protein
VCPTRADTPTYNLFRNGTTLTFCWILDGDRIWRKVQGRLWKFLQIWQMFGGWSTWKHNPNCYINIQVSNSNDTTEHSKIQSTLSDVTHMSQPTLSFLTKYSKIYNIWGLNKQLCLLNKASGSRNTDTINIKLSVINGSCFTRKQNVKNKMLIYNFTE